MPYFAYGSNHNAVDLKAWCARQRLPYPLGDVVGRAWLPDFQLVFDTYSGTRRGGVANVVRRKGFAAPGVVFRVKRRGWDTLSIKEGAPGFYHKLEVVTLAENGSGATEPMLCATYLLPPSETFIQPSVLYLRAIAGDYEARGLPPDQLHCAARDQDRPLPLFVYGTLKRGYRLHGLWRDLNSRARLLFPADCWTAAAFPV
jgi:hypothetical protein